MLDKEVVQDGYRTKTPGFTVNVGPRKIHIWLFWRHFGFMRPWYAWKTLMANVRGE